MLHQQFVGRGVQFVPRSLIRDAGRSGKRFVNVFVTATKLVTGTATKVEVQEVGLDPDSPRPSLAYGNRSSSLTASAASRKAPLSITSISMLMPTSANCA
jgi:hypothetical protein